MITEENSIINARPSTDSGITRQQKFRRLATIAGGAVFLMSVFATEFIKEMAKQSVGLIQYTASEIGKYFSNPSLDIEIVNSVEHQIKTLYDKERER